MTKNLLLFMIFALVSTQIQAQNNTLYKIFDGDYDEMGAPTGYVNQKGDTIVPLGKYFYCFTDTLEEFAIVLTHINNKCIAINAKDQYLFEVYWFDNGPDYLSDGLFRIIQNKKIGYANAKGQIIIPPQYQCASAFQDGKARVSYTCKKQKTDEHTTETSNEWIFINKTGTKIN